MAPFPTADGALDRSVLLLGARIRRLRKDRAMTIVQLAERSGLSHPFISQLERGRARPSMSSLFRIAETLGTDQQSLLAESISAAPEPGRAPDPGRAPTLLRRAHDATAEASGGVVRALVRGADHPFIPMEYVGDSTDWAAYWVHPEDEFVYVVTGGLHLDLDGAESALDEGDSVYVPGGVAHRWASPDGSPFRLLVVKQQLQA